MTTGIYVSGVKNWNNNKIIPPRDPLVSELAAIARLNKPETGFFSEFCLAAKAFEPTYKTKADWDEADETALLLAKFYHPQNVTYWHYFFFDTLSLAELGVMVKAVKDRQEVVKARLEKLSQGAYYTPVSCLSLQELKDLERGLRQQYQQAGDADAIETSFDKLLAA